MKELLVQNFLKRYMQRFEAPSAANSALMARIIANEIDLFLDGERSTQGLDQKALRKLEKDIEVILQEDPRLGSQMIPLEKKTKLHKTERRDYSQPHQVSVSHNGIVLPKIGSGLPAVSLTPARELN